MIIYSLTIYTAWKKLTKADSNRGFKDGETVEATKRKTAE